MATANYGRVRYVDGDGNVKVAQHGEEYTPANEMDEDTAEQLERAAETLPDDTSPRRNKPAPAANAPTKKAGAARETEKTQEG